MLIGDYPCIAHWEWSCLKANKDMEMSLPIDFSAEQYLYLHPDVRLSGIDPAVHYLTWGVGEGRPYKPNSDPLLPKVKGEFHSDGLRTVHNHDFMSDPRYIAAYD